MAPRFYFLFVLTGILVTTSVVDASTGGQEREDLRIAVEECREEFPAASVSVFDQAQSAWREFLAANDDAIQKSSSARTSNQGEIDVPRFEVLARTNQIRNFYKPLGTKRDSLLKQVQDADKVLTQTYMGCRHRLFGDAEASLNAAQTKWIAFRDANAKAAYLAVPSGEALMQTLATIQARQIELNDMYMGYSWTVGACARMTRDFRQAKVLADMKPRFALFQEKVKQAIASFASSEKLDNIGTFPKEIVNEASKIASSLEGPEPSPPKFGEFPEFCSPLWTLYSVVTLSKARDQLYSGDAPAASKTISDHLSNWQDAQDEALVPSRSYFTKLTTFFAQFQKEALKHIEKADAAAASGRTSEATLEYKAAYALFPDPQITEKTKKLREESLGL